MPNLICGKPAVGGNYNLTRDKSKAFKTFEERKCNKPGTGYWDDVYIAPVYEDGTIGARKFK